MSDFTVNIKDDEKVFFNKCQELCVHSVAAKLDPLKYGRAEVEIIVHAIHQAILWGFCIGRGQGAKIFQGAPKIIMPRKIH